VTRSMIAKTFCLAKIIHRIGTRSLRDKKGLPESWPIMVHSVAGWPAEQEPPASEYLATLRSSTGPVTTVTPPGTLDGRALAWPPRLTAYGENAPAW
jgi:hypothetical protein